MKMLLRSLLAFGLCELGYAQTQAVQQTESTETVDLDQHPSVQLEAALVKTDALSLVRVKVFPHDRQFAPHFADEDKQHLFFKSEKPCSIYEASESDAKTTYKFIMRVKSLAIDSKFLKIPLWIRCQAPFNLVREKPLRSFSYEGDLYVKRELNEEGQSYILAVNVLGLEPYLRGVVPTEVSAAWPMETLKSQAVAARSYAAFHLSYARKAFPNRLYDVDDTIVYQAYTGMDNQDPRTNAAVDVTSGQVMLYGNEVIQAYYHADSGGITAPAELAFQRNVPYCVSKKEPYALDLVKSEWQVDYSLEAIAHKLNARGIIATITELRDISISEESIQNGRVRSVNLVLASGVVKTISVHEFKRAVELGSTYFRITAQNTAYGPSYSFVGRGSGHGVGMNQRGAKVLAEVYSWNYEKILNFYYSGTEICSLHPSAEKSCFSTGG